VGYGVSADVQGSPRTSGLLIGGELRETAEWMPSDDPSTGGPWTEIPWCATSDVDAAVDAAREAFTGTQWRKAATQRGEVLRAIADTIRRHADELALIESRDNGKPLWATRVELGSVPKYFDYFAGLTDKIEGAYFPLEPDFNVTVRREPVGVVAAVIAWNSPMLLCGMKLAPALACGNTVVLKPAESASASTIRLGELLREVGLPPGVVNIVTGGPEIGTALIEHPSIDYVSFTGGDKTAEAVLAAAAPALTPVKIEAGGKAAHIIFEDADFDTALTAALAGAFISGGQSCTSGARVLVQDSIWDRFTDAFVERAGRLRVGGAQDARTHIGPVATDAHRRRIERYIQIGIDEGATCRLGAERPSDPALANGFYVQPAVMVDVTSQMTIAQDEIFGPVPALMRFSDEDDAIRIANSTRYGLSSGLWTKDISRAERVVDALDAGMLWINCYRVLHWAVPFGGYRRSGMGRENGTDALREYTHVKSVMTATNPSAVDPFHLEI
jgi:aldehyde dehydrogenase (NAD+)